LYHPKSTLKPKPAIQRYCRDWKAAKGEQHDFKKDCLDALDWEKLHHFGDLLPYFEKATKRVEDNAYTRSYGALRESIPTMAYLFAKLKKHADEVSESPHLFTNYMTALNHGFAKLSQYYTNIDDSPFYATAVVLHSCRRFTYFDENWSKTTGGGTAILTARQSTRRLFDEYLAHAVAETELSPEQVPLFISNNTQSDSDDKDWAIAFGERSVKTKERTTTLRRRQGTELNRFIDDDLDTDCTEFSQGKALIMSYADQPLCWWRERGEAIYPTLASMAYDLRAIPGMSSECERSFSAAKKMITEDRYSLSSMLERFKVPFFEGIRAPNKAPKQFLEYSIQFSVDTL
jgi:hypothetical protein